MRFIRGVVSAPPRSRCRGITGRTGRRWRSPSVSLEFRSNVRERLGAVGTDICHDRGLETSYSNERLCCADLVIDAFGRRIRTDGLVRSLTVPRFDELQIPCSDHPTGYRRERSRVGRSARPRRLLSGEEPALVRCDRSGPYPAFQAESAHQRLPSRRTPTTPAVRSHRRPPALETSALLVAPERERFDWHARTRTSFRLGRTPTVASSSPHTRSLAIHPLQPPWLAGLSPGSFCSGCAPLWVCTVTGPSTPRQVASSYARSASTTDR